MRVINIVRVLPVALLLSLTSCSGGGGGGSTVYCTDSNVPGEGQSIVVHRSNTNGLYDLYHVRENGGGAVRVDGDAYGAEYHAYSTSGRIIYSRAIKDTYSYTLCYIVPAYCWQESSFVIHNILYSANVNGADIIALDTYPDNGHLDDPANVIVKEHTFVALTVNERVLYRVNGSLVSTTLYGTNKVTLFDASSSIVSISKTGRVIYSSGGNLYSIQDDGGGQAILADSADIESVVHLSPDGEVYYLRYTSGQVDLYRVLEDGSSPQVVMQGICTNLPCSFYGTLTPAGRLLYIDNNSVLYAVKIDGSEAPGVLLGAGYLSDYRIRGITPDSRVVISGFDPNWIESGENLYTVGESGADATSPVAVSVTLGHEQFVGLTPSGRIIFEVEESTPGPGGKRYYDLYTIDSLGQALLPLMVTNGEDDRFSMITESGRILIQRTDNIVKQVYIASEDGSNMALLATVEFAGVDGVNVVKESTTNGRVIYGSTIYTSETGSHMDLHSVKEDGADNVKLLCSEQSEYFAGMF